MDYVLARRLTERTLFEKHDLEELERLDQHPE
jgi:hypothetical protein